jgi:hypothetical protein
MVWGMRLPDNFGVFWPSGEFEYDPKKKDTGWYDRLERHYLAQAPEEQLRLYDHRFLNDGESNVEWGAGHYRTYVSSKFRCEFGTKDPLLHQLPVNRIELHEPPITFDTDKPYASLGSMIKLNDRIVAVDDVIKQIIERLEPGHHQFYPLEITMPNTRRFPGSYYTLVIGQWFSSYLPERSDTSKKNFAGLFFSKEAFGNAHFWKDRGTPALTYFSDELRSEIEKAGLRIPKLYKLKEVIDDSDAQRAQGSA